MDNEKATLRSRRNNSSIAPFLSMFQDSRVRLRDSSGIFSTDAELHAARGEKEKSLEALEPMLTLPDEGLIRRAYSAWNGGVAGMVSIVRNASPFVILLSG